MVRIQESLHEWLFCVSLSLYSVALPFVLACEACQDSLLCWGFSSVVALLEMCGLGFVLFLVITSMSLEAFSVFPYTYAFS